MQKYNISKQKSRQKNSQVASRSLDLEALTAVCLSLGLAEDTDSTLLQNPVSMLNALQKVSEKLLIFCEAGQIKMPGTPSVLSLLPDKMIVPVALPKVWGIGKTLVACGAIVKTARLRLKEGNDRLIVAASSF